MKQERETNQKKLIRELMVGNLIHPTADKIYDLARVIEPNISRGTVYRNLNQLAADGKIRRLAMPEGPDHYDGTVHGHYHFLCRICNSVMDLAVPYEERLNEVVPKLKGYQPEYHELVVVGLCPNCLT